MTDRPRSARPPASPRAFLSWFWQLTKDVVNEYRQDGAGDLAASITFWTVVSIPAAVLALISGLSSLDAVAGSSVAADVERRAQDFIDDQFVNSAALSSAVDELFGSANTGVITVASIVAVLSLSRAFTGLIRALDNAYGVERGRSWWHTRIVAVGLGASTLLVVAAAATVLALLPELGGLARWLTAPIVMVTLVAWAAMVFHIGPNHRTPWRFDIPGAIVTALGWALSTQLFALYVRLTAGRNEVQSTVGAVLLFLSLMYVLGTVIIVGAELNDVISRRAGVVQARPSVRAKARTLRDRLKNTH